MGMRFRIEISVLRGETEILTFWAGGRNKIDRTSSTQRSRANQPGFVVSGGGLGLAESTSAMAISCQLSFWRVFPATVLPLYQSLADPVRRKGSWVQHNSGARAEEPVFRILVNFPESRSAHF